MRTEVFLPGSVRYHHLSNVSNHFHKFAQTFIRILTAYRTFNDGQNIYMMLRDLIDCFKLVINKIRLEICRLKTLLFLPS